MTSVPRKSDVDLIFVELRQTCEACPSQWEARDDTGRQVYIRYRSGVLSWGFGRTKIEAIRDSMTKAGLVLGDSLDGYLDEDAMLGHLNARVHR
jgi:hypothetical protein